MRAMERRWRRSNLFDGPDKVGSRLVEKERMKSVHPLYKENLEASVSTRSLFFLLTRYPYIRLVLCTHICIDKTSGFVHEICSGCVAREKWALADVLVQFPTERKCILFVRNLLNAENEKEIVDQRYLWLYTPRHESIRESFLLSGVNFEKQRKVS